jgi:hypothetical protein
MVGDPLTSSAMPASTWRFFTERYDDRRGRFDDLAAKTVTVLCERPSDQSLHAGPRWKAGDSQFVPPGERVVGVVNAVALLPGFAATLQEVLIDCVSEPCVIDTDSEDIKHASLYWPTGRSVARGGDVSPLIRAVTATELNLALPSRYTLVRVSTVPKHRGLICNG